MAPPEPCKAKRSATSAARPVALAYLSVLCYEVHSISNVCLCNIFLYSTCVMYVCVFSIIIYVYLTVEEPKHTMYVYMYMCMHVEMASCKASVNLYTRVLHQIYIPCIIAITSWKRSKHPSHVYNSKQATSSGHPFIPAYSNDPTGIQLASINMPFPASPLIIHMIRRSLAEVTNYPSPPIIPVI